MRLFYSLCFIICFATFGYAQDIVVKKNNDVIRCTILGTDFKSVRYSVDDAIPVISTIKDVKEFVWNGESYIIKTFFDKKKAEDFFVKIIETGVINLYAIGGTISSGVPVEKVKSKPQVQIGIGSGGMSGLGLGGGINIGRNRVEQAPTSTTVKTRYYIEKPGTGAIQEVNLNNLSATKSLLLLKLGDDADLAERIKNIDELDGKGLIAFIIAYNSAR